MTNAQVARTLREIAAAYTIKDEAKFRFQIIAYQRAADAVEHATSEIKDLFEDKKPEKLPGIGPSIRRHLEELFKTGKVKHFAWVKKGIPSSVFPLLQIPSFGPKKAFRLVNAFNLHKPESVIDEIEKQAGSGKIATLEGFGEKSQADILQAISEYRQGKAKSARMPLPYAFELAEKMLSYLKKSPHVVDAASLGSLRRMVATVGDIDIAVATKKPKEVIDHFVKYPGAQRVIEKGITTASVLTSGGKQIDLMVQPPESFGSLLQHFTGSKNHNIKLREYALTKGWSLSEKGIKRHVARGTWRMGEYDTEEKFYKALGMDWIPPEMREDTGEIELALQHKLPKLVELSDIKGDIHIHSSYPIEPSHDLGQNAMEEMLAKAKDMGYAYLGFSEHNPSMTKHTKNQIYSILAKRKEKIEQLKKNKKGVRIVNLLEVDILVDGSLAIDDKALSFVDAIIASVHSSFDQSRDQMTKRVLRGLSYPKAKILGHPTGRLLNAREGYELDWDVVFEFCKKHNRALEINAWPLRLDLPDTLVREAVKQGVRLVINTDSHKLSQMSLMRYGVSVARRGWATTSDVVNTWDFTKLAEWFNISH